MWAGRRSAGGTGMGITIAPQLRRPRAVPARAAAAGGRRVPRPVDPRPRPLPVRGPGAGRAVRPALLLVSARRVAAQRPPRMRGEPRISQLARLRHRPSRPRVRGRQRPCRLGRRGQLERAAFALEQFARGAPMLLGGDLNAGPARRACAGCRARGWTRTPAMSASTICWCAASRRVAGTRWSPDGATCAAMAPAVRLSDHDPVDAVVSFA